MTGHGRTRGPAANGKSLEYLLSLFRIAEGNCGNWSYYDSVPS